MSTTIAAFAVAGYTVLCLLAGYWYAARPAGCGMCREFLKTNEWLIGLLAASQKATSDRPTAQSVFALMRDREHGRQIAYPLPQEVQEKPKLKDAEPLVLNGAFPL